MDKSAAVEEGFLFLLFLLFLRFVMLIALVQDLQREGQDAFSESVLKGYAFSRLERYWTSDQGPSGADIHDHTIKRTCSLTPEFHRKTDIRTHILMALLRLKHPPQAVRKP